MWSKNNIVLKGFRADVKLGIVYAIGIGTSYYYFG